LVGITLWTIGAAAAAQTPAGLEEAFALVRPFAVAEARMESEVPTRLILPAPGTSKLDGARIVAYEEHALFTYVAMDASSLFAPEGAQGQVAVLRRIVHCKSNTLVVDDLVRGAKAEEIVGTLQTSATVRTSPERKEKPKQKKLPDQVVIAGKDGDLVLVPLFPAQRSLKIAPEGAATRTQVITKRHGEHLRQINLLCVRRPAPTWSLQTQVRAQDDKPVTVTVALDERRYKLELGRDQIVPGTIEVQGKDGQPLLARRVLASGVLPHGTEGAKLLERWDSAYRSDQRPPWDIGRPASQLRELVEKGAIRPGRAIELGSGPGTDATYLAGKGFDMTAVDIAPTAINKAAAKAEAANVKVRWVLADVTAIPDLGTYDFLYDRGCYHGVRRQAAEKYRATLRKLTHTGSQVLILAGNANEPPPHTGPPRVKEAEVRADFSKDFEINIKESRFDSSDVDQNGPWAWTILLKRK
jgi:hypothetical protein